jgi:O-antigen/teichoic acid export membrane protein
MDEYRAGIEHEKQIALINALKLTLSLTATLLIAVAIRFWLPRVLGPAVFGKLHFAESLALGLFLFTTLGAEVYIRKEIATRPSHASDFFGGLLIVRAICSVFVFGLMALTLSLMGKNGIEWRLAFIFGIGQVAFVFEQTLAALLHASGRVTALSLLNAGSKIVWGIAIFGGVLLGGGPELVAVAFAVTEWGKGIALFFIVRRVTSLELRIRWRVSLHMLAASFPFFLNYLAHRVYERIDVQMLSVMTNDQEVGD